MGSCRTHEEVNAHLWSAGAHVSQWGHNLVPIYSWTSSTLTSQSATFPFCCPLQLITVYSLPGMDPDWLIGERGNKKGKVPVTYLELLS